MNLLNKRALLAAGACIALFALAPTADAARADKKTRLTVGETIEIPGATLRPGKYVIKLVNTEVNRHIVRFFNEDETDVISTVIAIPNRRLRPTGNSKFSFYEMPAGQPPAMRSWFYPGDNFGQEFVYPKKRAGELARLTGLNVPGAPDETETTMRTKPRQPADPPPVILRETTIIAIDRDNQETDTDTGATRNAEAERQSPPKPRATEPIMAREDPDEDTVTMAQAQPRKPSPSRLPDTASPAPLLGLIGLLSLGGALGLRRFAINRGR